MTNEIKTVKITDYVKLLHEYGYVPAQIGWGVSELRLKDLNFKKVPEVKKALDGLDITKCDFIVLSSSLTKYSSFGDYEQFIIKKPAANLNAIKHYISSYTNERGDLPVGVVEGDACYPEWISIYTTENDYNKTKKRLEEFFNKTLPEAITAARNLWEPSMKEFSIEISKRKNELEVAKKGLQDAKNRFYKSLKKKKELLKDFKD